MPKKPLFTRGYDESRKRMEKNSRFTRSCFNCAFYYLMHGDKEEMCQNSDVLEYDMIVEGNNVYCLKWQPASKVETEQQKLFKKRGREVLD